MEKSGLVVKLPPGFRFHPTDQELVVQYLLRKVLSYPLPASVIPDIHLSRYDPWDLPSGGVGCGLNESYLFNYKKGGRKGFRRAAGSGYWNVRGKDKEVMVGRHVVGLKRVMVFYRGKPSNRSRTDWVLHEYSLSQKSSTTRTASTHMEGWVLCHVFQDRRPTKDNDSKMILLYKSKQDRYVDFMKQRDDNLGLINLEMESSCVTQVSDEFIEEADSSTSNCSKVQGEEALKFKKKN